MDQPPSPSGPPALAPAADAASPVGLTQTPPSAPTRKRSTSGASGLLSRFSFMRSSGDHHRPRSRRSTEEIDSSPTTFPPVPSFHTIHAEASPADVAPVFSPQPPPLSHAILQQQTQQQQKTRRRRGSLRKVALLGRGAQREKREARGIPVVEGKYQVDGPSSDGRGGATGNIITTGPSPLDRLETNLFPSGGDALGLGISDVTPRPSMDGYASRSATAPPSSDNSQITPRAITAPVTASNLRDSSTTDSSITSPTISYSTTDDEDTLHMAGSIPRPSAPSTSVSPTSVNLLRPERASLSSGSESYFPTLSSHTHARPLGMGTSPNGVGTLPSMQRRRSTIQRAKSPLALTSLSGLATTPIPPSDTDWDYSETEWWGWIILIVTWTVFVVGIGSCFGVWSWAWDVGTTPYAPPELEDDPTLPIVGYYPALIILTAVMAWVWVTVAWMGMKYFRHARVSGD